MFLQMGMSPSRMQQAPSMMAGHANNMVGQPPNQNQFMNQTPFSSAGGMNVNVNLSQQSGQSVPQVRSQKCPFSIGVSLFVVLLRHSSETFHQHFLTSCHMMSEIVPTHFFTFFGYGSIFPIHFSTVIFKNLLLAMNQANQLRAESQQ